MSDKYRYSIKREMNENTNKFEYIPIISTNIQSIILSRCATKILAYKMVANELLAIANRGNA